MECEKYIIKSVSKQKRYIISCYLDFIKLGLQSALNEKLSFDIKQKKFDLLYKQIFKNCVLKNNIIAKLQSIFVSENISLSLLSDMIKAFKQISDCNHDLNWSTKLYSNQLLISPLVRMLIVLNELNYSVYMPFASLMMCVVLVSDVRSKKIKHRRFYLSKIKGFLKDGKILPLVVKNKAFRFKVWCIVIALDIMVLKFERKEKVCLSKFDLIKILFYASVKWIFTKVRTLQIKGV